MHIVRFKSGLSDEDVRATFEARAPQYRAVSGLIQKYYLRFPEPREYAGVYLWDSRDSLQDFRTSELARTISDAYRVEGVPQVEVAEVALHPELEQAAPSHPS